MENATPEPSSSSRKMGCWVLPLIMGVLAFGGGIWLMDSWSQINGPLKALAVLLVAFGSFMLVPVMLYFAFLFWMRRLKNQIAEAGKELGEAMESMRDNARVLYESPQEYRDANEEDFAGVDVAFYDRIEAEFRAAGFRKLGDTISKTLEDMGQPSPPLRVMVSSDGTRTGAFYHFAMGEVSNQIVELLTEFDDGTFLETANTAGLVFSTVPPEIERRQFEPGTSTAVLIEAHERELAKLLAAKEGRRCQMIATLGEAIAANLRLHEAKRAQRASEDYLDENEVRRVSETMERDGGTSAAKSR